MSLSTLSSWALLISRALTAAGIDADELFRRAGMPPERLRDPNSRYPLSAMQRLWALALQATQDPCFGLEVARLWHPTTFHAMGYSALACATLREALAYAVRYSRVVSAGAILELIDRGAQVNMRLSVPARPESMAVSSMQAPVHAGLASIVILCREARGAPLGLQRVSFTGADCGCGPRLAAFFNCPVVFEAEHNDIVFTAIELDTALPTANPALLRVNEQLLAHYLARLESSELAVRVQSYLIQLLPSGEFEEAAVARALNLSLRTMQRRLRQEGTSFRELLDETRERLAAQYLEDSTMSVSEVAYLLGFSEVSSFSRAMRRWPQRAQRSHRQPRMLLDQSPISADSIPVQTPKGD
jgi:AraC-like DNA-binding protein